MATYARRERKSLRLARVVAVGRAAGFALHDGQHGDVVGAALRHEDRGVAFGALGYLFVKGMGKDHGLYA